MADLLDPPQRSQLASGPVVLHVAEDELDCFGQAAGRLGLPDFAVSAGADLFGQRVSCNRLGSYGKVD